MFTQAIYYVNRNKYVNFDLLNCVFVLRCVGWFKVGVLFNVTNNIYMIATRIVNVHAFGCIHNWFEQFNAWPI